MTARPPNIEVRCDMEDVTRDGTMWPFIRDVSRRFRPGLERYFVDGVEVSKEEAERIAKQWEQHSE